MRYSRRYIVFTIVLVLLFFLKLSDVSDNAARVEQFRGAKLEEEVFYPLMAADINQEKMVKASFDGEDIPAAYRDLLVDEKMHVLASVDFIQKYFRCGVHVYDDGRFVWQRGTQEGTFFLKKRSGILDDQPVKLSHAPVSAEGISYLPLADVCEWTGCSYNWDVNTRTVTLGSNGHDKVELPDKYDLRAEKRVSRIRDQGSEAECWADASIGALESSLLPEQKAHFSVEDMVKNNSFRLDPDAGGDYEMASAYLLSWQGPVEKAGGGAVKHLQGVQFLPKGDREAIKWAVLQYGGVTTSLYVDISGADINDSSYYSAATNAYCYSGSNKPNHDVIIIGWDDGFSRANFGGGAKSNGAFICQNSWGSDFGEDGVFYVSYSDVNIGSQCVSYTDIQPADNFDHIYQSDLCGWIGQVGYGSDTIYAANTYEADGGQNIDAAGFYTLGADTEYQIYFVSNCQDASTLAHRSLVAQGTISGRGYHTICFDKPRAVEKGERFAVVLALKTPDATQPMAIEYEADDRTRHVDISDGEGYISADGSNWESVEAKMYGNLCLKAYATDQVSE